MTASTPRRVAGAALVLAAFVAYAVGSLGGVALGGASDLDPSFSGDGKAFLDGKSADAMARQPSDGKILIASSAGSDLYVARFNANGTVDSGFGSSGVAAATFSGDALATEVLVDGSGNIFVVGSKEEETAFDADLAIAKFDSTGAPVNAFDGDGKVTHTPDDAFALGAALSGGILYVTGAIDKVGGIAGHYDVLLARFSATTGALDASGAGPFASGGGIVSTDLGGATQRRSLGSAVAVQGDGKIVVAGSDGIPVATDEDEDVLALRYNTDGSPDTGFDGDGRVLYNLLFHERATAVAIEPATNKVMVGGSVSAEPGSHLGDTQFLLMRLETNGALDPSFDAGDGQAGWARTSFAGDNTGRDVSNSLAIQGDGKYLLSGTTDVCEVASETDYGIARYNTNGTADSSFSGDGRVFYDIEDGSFDFGVGLALTSDPSQKILVGGQYFGLAPGAGDGIAVIRLNDGNVSNTNPVCPTPPQQTLTVKLAGSGAGTVTGPGINCPGDCTQSYNRFTFPTLVAAPASGSGFGSWAGECEVEFLESPTECEPFMDADKTVTATFNAATKPGGGGGGPPGGTAQPTTPDRDRDTIADAADNCADTANTDQKDGDGDRIGDVCDPDPSLPDSCTLRQARSRVFVYKSKDKVRLVVKYKTKGSAEVTTSYSAKLANGKQQPIGTLKQKFKAEGIFKLEKALNAKSMDKVRAAKSFSVNFSIPGTPKSCARFYAKQLTKQQKVGGQTVWFQSDSILTGF